MLVRHRDAMEETFGGVASGEGYDSRLLLFPSAFNAAHRELARCLEAMRAVPILRWHTLAWHVSVEYVQKPIYVRKATRKGWERMISGYRLEPIRHRDAVKAIADEGVGWLGGRFSWDRVGLLAIRAACGDVKAQAEEARRRGA
jgi:hypothetical protein